MKNEFTVLKSLLLLAFIFQLMIDVGGFLGWYYNQYPKAAFEFAGYGSKLPFSVLFPTYLLWVLAYNISIVLMYLQSRFAKHFVIATLIISLVTSFTSGIYVGTPYELFLSWFSWSAYIAACTMLFTLTKFKNV